MHHACKAISSCSAQLELIRLSRGKPALLSKTCSDNRLPGCWQRGSHRVNFQLGAWRMLPVGLFCGVGEKGGERAEVSGRSCVLLSRQGTGTVLLPPAVPSAAAQPMHCAITSCNALPLRALPQDR